MVFLFVYVRVLWGSSIVVIVHFCRDGLSASWKPDYFSFPVGSVHCPPMRPVLHTYMPWEQDYKIHNFGRKSIERPQIRNVSHNPPSRLLCLCYVALIQSYLSVLFDHQEWTCNTPLRIPNPVSSTCETVHSAAHVRCHLCFLDIATTTCHVGVACWSRSTHAMSKSSCCVFQTHANSTSETCALPVFKPVCENRNSCMCQ